MRHQTRLPALLALLGLVACEQEPPLESQPPQSPQSLTTQQDADVLIIGAGLAGLSAAIDAASGGARVLVIDMNSVFGGHGIQSGGVAIVGSPMQEELGVRDSPAQAYEDWMEWAVDGHPEWTRFYAENSREMIYDWVTGFGVRFDRVQPSHGNSLPRFHMTLRRGLNLTRPLYLEALRYSNITFRWNSNADHLLMDGNRVIGAEGIDWRAGQRFELRAPKVVLATGGFQSNIDMVKDNWPKDLPAPGEVYSMSGQNSRGSGHRMAAEAGAALVNLDRQYNGYSALPNVLGLETDRGFVGGNGRAIWVNDQGQRFVTEFGIDRYVFPAVMRQQPGGHWAIYDDDDKQGFSILSPHFVAADGLDTQKIQRLFVDNRQVTQTGATIEELAAAAGLPAAALAVTVRRFNQQIADGESTDIDGLPPEGEPADFTLDTPPFYATKLYPMANKSAGGISIGLNTHALDTLGDPVPGLYAAGEVTGSAGINGLNGLDGMFTGPSILTGRVAGQTVAAELALDAEWIPAVFTRDEGNMAGAVDELSAGQWVAALGADELRALLEETRDGYWHFERVHHLVLERGYECSDCHSAEVPFYAATTVAYRAAQAQICDTCHLAPERLVPVAGAARQSASSPD